MAEYPKKNEINTTGKSKVEGTQKASFAKGESSNHMLGQQHAGPQKPGTESHDTSGDGGKFAKGGGGKMFGFRPSVPAKPGMTTPE
jgi:hypothetical protein